jgi:Zn-finger nucleic acid-binding protein
MTARRIAGLYNSGVTDPYRDPPPLAPYRTAGAPGSQCPRCGVGLASHEIAGVRLEACGRCDGQFVTRETLQELNADHAVLDELRALLGRRRDPVADGGPMYVKCPSCSTVMTRTQYAHRARVVIDFCTRHGVWFDGGELAQVLDFIAGGGMDRAKQWADEQARIAEQDIRFRHELMLARGRGQAASATRAGSTLSLFADLFL